VQAANFRAKYERKIEVYMYNTHSLVTASHAKYIIWYGRVWTNAGSISLGRQLAHLLYDALVNYWDA